MKRLLFLTVCLASVAATVQAQRINTSQHYCETWDEHTNKLTGKEWVSGGNLRAEPVGEDGNARVIIYRADSAKVFMLDTQRKTYRAITLDQMTSGSVMGLTALEVAERTSNREFLRTEMVEGDMCDVFFVRTTRTQNNGVTEEGSRTEWIRQSDKMLMRYDEGGFRWITRNIAKGPQPAHLFEIPKDYRGMSIPAGGIMEMLTGKPKAENEKNMQDAFDPNSEGMKKMQEAAKILQGMGGGKK